MRSHARFAMLFVTGLLLGAPARAVLADEASPTHAPSTADVLGKIHSTNVKEYRMGKLAQQRGRSEQVRTFGQTLITDHDAADDKVVALARQEGITLAAHTPAVVEEPMPMGAGFDAAFARAMLEGHKKNIAALQQARAATDDGNLKALIDQLLPVLVKHEATARSLVDLEPGKT